MSLLANSSPFLDIFAGHLNESPGMVMEEKKRIPILSFFPGGAVQFREGVRGDPLEGCTLRDSIALSCTLRNRSFPGGKGERAAGGGRQPCSHNLPHTSLGMAAGFEEDEVLADGLGGLGISRRFWMGWKRAGLNLKHNLYRLNKLFRVSSITPDCQCHTV